MSTDTNKAIVRRYIDQVLDKGHADLAGEFLAENIEFHGTNLAPGLAAIEEYVVTFAAAFPDRHVSADDVVAEGDRVVARTTMTGKHLGDFQGIPATGKPVNQSSISIFRMANGKIAEAWFAADNLSMMQQLGVIPIPQNAS